MTLALRGQWAAVEHWMWGLRSTRSCQPCPLGSLTLQGCANAHGETSRNQYPSQEPCNENEQRVDNEDLEHLVLSLRRVNGQLLLWLQQVGKKRSARVERAHDPTANGTA